jgi:tetratricopeptide (TPR) repeat protein
MATDMEVPATATPIASLQETSADHVSAGRPAGERAPERIVLVPLESRALRLLILMVIVVGAAWMAKVIVSPAIADYLLSNASGITDLRRAVAWNPGDPALHLRLAQAYDRTIDASGTKQAQHQFEMALRLQPTSGSTWLQLAQLADRLDEHERARQALDTSLRLDPHNVWLRWEAALLTLRWGERDTALEHLRYVLAANPAQADAAFQLAMAILDPEISPASLLPSKAESLLVIIRLAMRDGNLPLARAAWERHSELSAAMLPNLQREYLQRDYLEFLIQEGDAAGARALWTQVAPASIADNSGNLVWNGGFERERLRGWGFDWQVRHAWGMEISLDRFAAASGRQSLRLSFNSFPTLDFFGVYQRVAVEPGSAYHLRTMAKALDFTTQSGVKLQVVTHDGEQVLGETPAIAGTTEDWVTLEADVQVPPDITLVMLRVRREPAPGPEGNLGGKVWLDDIRLTPVGGVSG